MEDFFNSLNKYDLNSDDKEKLKYFTQYSSFLKKAYKHICAIDPIFNPCLICYNKMENDAAHWDPCPEIKIGITFGHHFEEEEIDFDFTYNICEKLHKLGILKSMVVSARIACHLESSGMYAPSICEYCSDKHNIQYVYCNSCNHKCVNIFTKKLKNDYYCKKCYKKIKILQKYLPDDIIIGIAKYQITNDDESDDESDEE